ncbi:hypothetical protein ABWK46_18925, partial [Peribacillus frigoritolerans]|uniref:hypothetical protein n=1 Tax=Peribacillus frigoritolerans TaxID=450367 RepID=UPI00339B3B0F
QTEINIKSKSRLYFLEVSWTMEESRNVSGFFMNIQNSFDYIGSLPIRMTVSSNEGSLYYN